MREVRKTLRAMMATDSGVSEVSSMYDLDESGVFFMCNVCLYWHVLDVLFHVNTYYLFWLLQYYTTT